MDAGPQPSAQPSSSQPPSSKSSSSTAVSKMPRLPQLKVLGLGLAVGAIALAITNPGQSAYVDYAAERLPKTLKQECKALKKDINLADAVRLPTQDLCRSLVHGADLVGRGVVKQVINVSTQRQNWGVLSWYTTEVPGRTFKTVGIARQFWMIGDR